MKGQKLSTSFAAAHISPAAPILVIVFCSFLAFIEARPAALLDDPDTLWHIQAGKWMLEHFNFLSVDTFSYTAAGVFWMNTEWLSQVIYAAVFNIGGFNAVAFLAALVCAATVTVVSDYLLNEMRFSVAIGWASLSWLAIKPHFLARPHIFSYLLLTIWMTFLLRAEDDRGLGWRHLLPLSGLAVIWANLHGSFTLGLLFLYIFVGAQVLRCRSVGDWKGCLAPVCLCVVVTSSCLLNPNGYRAFLATLEVLRMSHALASVHEAQAPDFQNDKLHLVLLVSLLGGMLALRLRLGLARILVFSAIFTMGLSYMRGLIMFFLLTPMLLARPFAESHAFFYANRLQQPASDPDHVIKFIRLYGMTLALPFLALGLSGSAMLLTRSLEPPQSIAPKAALEFVRRERIPGNVFNHYNFGGYLIASGIPTFVDGRDFPFGDSFLAEYSSAAAVVDIRESFKLLDRYKINWTLLPPQEPLNRALKESSGWREAYSDDYAVVFVRAQ